MILSDCVISVSQSRAGSPCFIQSKFQSPHNDLQSPTWSGSLLPSDLTSCCFSPFTFLQSHRLPCSSLNIPFTAHLSAFALAVSSVFSLWPSPCPSSISLLRCHLLSEACVFAMSPLYLPWHSWFFLPVLTLPIPIAFNPLWHIGIFFVVYCLSPLSECNLHEGTEIFVGLLFFFIMVLWAFRTVLVK